MRLLLSLLLLSLSISINNAQQLGYLQQNLTSNWKFYQEGNTTLYPATVPGTIHLDLISNKLIEDPYFRENANDVQWVENITWIYTSTFDVDSIVFQGQAIELVFEGLDTHATVLLNDQKILEAENMFVKYVVDAKTALKQTANNLTVILYPAPLYDQQQIDQHEPLELPCDTDKGRTYSRKAAYHFGWDWGPRLVTAGIWRNVYLQAWTFARIDNIYLNQTFVNSTFAEVSAQVEMQVMQKGEYELRVTNADTGEVYSDGKTVLDPSFTPILTGKLTFQNPKLWWVRNFGEPYLYPIRVQVLYQGEIIGDKVVNLGLRTIELVQEKDEIGTSFYFRINGVPVFAKGGNYIPPDVFMPRVTPEKYEEILKDAVDANYNFIRIWGGGNYESDFFYNLCDKYGILIWHDFMFANAMYLGDQEFLTKLTIEFTDNIKRLRNHPSIALWCGNNEIEAQWENLNWKKNLTESQRKTVYGWYENIFLYLIPSVLNQTDGSRPYWPSSPSHRGGDPLSLTEGDSHYYGVWGDAPIENYTTNVGRFMSEYGVQGFPSLTSVRKYTLPEDRWLNSSVIQFHEKGASAYEHINFYVLGYYNNATNFEKFLYLTQIMQKYAIQTAVEAHRFNKPRNMGTLVWQLNDDWPVFSWSTRDYYGAWKAVHYMTKRKYQDVIVSITSGVDSQNNTQYDVYVVSDKLFDFNATLSVFIMDLDGTVRYSWNSTILIPAASSKIWHTIENDKFNNLNQKESFMYANITYDFGETFSDTTAYFVRPKDLELKNANITLTLDVLKDTIHLKSDTLAIGVYVYNGLYLTDFFFDDNYFDLLPNQVKTIKLLRVAMKDIPENDYVFKTLHLYQSYSDNAFESKVNILQPKKDLLRKSSVITY